MCEEGVEVHGLPKVTLSMVRLHVVRGATNYFRLGDQNSKSLIAYKFAQINQEYTHSSRLDMLNKMAISKF
jgi:hypothetical protein